MKIVDLVMFSGGLDSAYILYQKLVNTDNRVHAHHIRFRNFIENRWREEENAVNSIYTWLIQNVRNFELTKSTWEFPFRGHIGRDSDLVEVVAQKVAPNLVKEKCSIQVHIGLSCSDQIENRIKRGVYDNLWKSLCDSIDDPRGKFVSRDLNYKYLIDNKITKSDMIKHLPTELFKLTWSCRTPINGNPCNVCHSCIEIVKALKNIT